MAVMSTAIADSISKSYYLGPFAISGINPPPNDNTYDWWANTMRVNGAYKMWWVRGAPHDRVYYAESTDGIHYYNTQQVLAPAENDVERMHVGSPCVILLPSGTYYIFYEAPAGSEYSDGPDGSIFMATSTDGIHWNKYPSNTDPRPVIEGYNKHQSHYGCGLPTVFYKDGKFVIYYVDDCQGTGNRTRRAESYDGIHWGTTAGLTQLPTEHPVVLYGAPGDIKYSPLLGKCVMTFSMNGTLVGQTEDNFSHDVYVAVSLDADGKQWATTTPNTVSMATPARNVTATADPDMTYRLRSFPTFVTNQLGQIDTKTFQLNYMKGKQATINEDWKIYCSTWDMYSVLVNLDAFSADPIMFPDGFDMLDSSGTIYRISGDTKHSYCNWETYCALNPGRENDYDRVPDSNISAISTGLFYLEGLNITGSSGQPIYWIYNFSRYGYADQQDFLLQNPDGKVYTLDDAQLNAVIRDFPYMGLRSPKSAPSLGSIKAAGDGESVTLRGKVVTAALGDYFYAEEPDRSSGIRITGNANPGELVDVLGSLVTLNGERTITSTVINRFPGGPTLAPLGVSCASTLNGLSTVGLYVVVWGKVTSAMTTYFTLNDGSSRYLRVYGKATRNSYVSVLGVMGAEIRGTSTVPIVRAISVTTLG